METAIKILFIAGFGPIIPKPKQPGEFRSPHLADRQSRNGRFCYNFRVACHPPTSRFHCIIHCLSVRGSMPTCLSSPLPLYFYSSWRIFL